MKSKKSYDLQTLKTSSQRLYKNYKAKIVDILVFGSFVKGKQNPNDVDVCIIFKNSQPNFAEEFYQEFKKEFKDAHYNWLLSENMLDASLFSTLIEEGYSLINDKLLSESLGYKSNFVFSFNNSKLAPSEKVRFSYALHGQGSKSGILNDVNGQLLGQGVLLIPAQHSEKIREFLDYWKSDYSVKRVLIS